MSMFSSAATTGEMRRLAVMSNASIGLFMAHFPRGGPIEWLYFS